MRTTLMRLVSALCLLLSSPVWAAPVYRPKLIVVISIDQFAASVYERYRGTFSDGLKRLSTGISYPVAFQSHASTETCPGHSTMLTGDHPSHTGIVANNWFDRSAGTSVYCVTVAGTGDPSARGPQKLVATTLGDWIKQKYPDSRVVSISGKDRAAIMLGGHHADLAAWWSDGFIDEKRVFGFQTSQFAGAAGPRIAAILKQENEAIEAKWRRTPPQLWPSDIPNSCRALERPHYFGSIDISGVVPPQAAVEATARSGFINLSQFQEALHASPQFDDLTLRLAADVAKQWKLGSRRDPDVLAISLSATDYIGHRYGNGGAEMCGQVHALDTNLGAFLRQIDELGVRYMVVLTADHGSVDAPERLREQGIDAHRVDGAKLVGELNRHLKQVFAINWDPITGDDAQQLYINSPGDAAFLDRLRVEATNWIRRQPDIYAVFNRDEVAAAVPAQAKSPADLTMLERLNESYDASRSADLFVVFKRFTTLGWPRGPSDAVAGHGSPWDYDRSVPLLFWWSGAPTRSPGTPTETVDIAPTLAHMIGLAPPHVDGRCLVAVTNCE